MSNKNRVQLHDDKLFFHEAGRFRRQGDNPVELKERLVKLGYSDQAELVDKIRWLNRPTGPKVAVDPPGSPRPQNIFGSMELSRRPFNFGTIIDEQVDAVEWLEALGALRLDNHFQCHWAACTMVVATDGWTTDKITRRGRRWTMQPPDLPRAAFLLHWKDHRDVFEDWDRHLDRLRWLKSRDAVNDFTRSKMREDGFMRRIMPPMPVVLASPRIVLSTTDNLVNPEQDVKMEFIQMLPRVKAQLKDDDDGQRSLHGPNKGDV